MPQIFAAMLIARNMGLKTVSRNTRPAGGLWASIWSRNVHLSFGRLLRPLGSADLRISMLPINTAQRRIIIERVALQLVEVMKVLCARVDDIGSAGADARGSRGGAPDIGQRVHRKIHDSADCIAGIRRAQQGQLDKRALTNAPHTEGLPEISLVRWQSPVRCHIEDAGDTDRGI